MALRKRGKAGFWHAYFRTVTARPDGTLKYAMRTVNLGTTDYTTARAMEAEGAAVVLLEKDLTAETFLKAMKGLESFRGESDLGTWLCAIAKNQYLSHLRKHPETLPLEEAHHLPLQCSPVGGEFRCGKPCDGPRGHRQPIPHPAALDDYGAGEGVGGKQSAV